MHKFPAVTIDQMREVDRIMVDVIGVSILMMMENASRNIAILSRKLLNGVACFLATAAQTLGPNAKVQYSIAQHSNILLHEPNSHQKLAHAIQQADLVIDALLGYNLKGDPKEPIASMVTTAIDSKKPILSVDIPSGLDGNTGKPHSPAIKAKATLTLALPKVGLLKTCAKEYVGDLYVTDLSVPKVVYDKVGKRVPNLFDKEEIIKIPSFVN